MSTSFDEEKLKDIVKSAVREALAEQRELVREAIEEAIEDVVLVRAIEQGLQSPTVTREEVFEILEGKP